MRGVRPAPGSLRGAGASQGRRDRHPRDAGIMAAKQATTTIPIVMATSGDAVASGLVASLSRPGGNVTGSTFFNPELAAKRLELLKEAMPGLTDVGILLNPANPMIGPVLPAMTLTAQPLKLELHQFGVRGPDRARRRFCRNGGKTCRRSCGPRRCDPDLRCSGGRQASVAAPAAVDRVARLCRCRRRDGLWRELSRPVPARGDVRRQDF